MVKSYNNYDKEKDKVQNRLNKYGIFLGPRGPLGTPLSVRVSVRTKYKLDPTCAIFLKMLGHKGVKYYILMITKKTQTQPKSKKRQIQRQRQRQRQMQSKEKTLHVPYFRKAYGTRISIMTFSVRHQRIIRFTRFTRFP